MAYNTIASRIADFLNAFPPFSLLEKDQLEKVSREISVQYFEKGKLIFQKGEAVHDCFYIVNKGAVDLQKYNEQQIPETIDKCDEGDVFGLRPLFAKENYQINAITSEESVIYAIPLKIFKPLAISNSRVGNFDGKFRLQHPQPLRHRASREVVYGRGRRDQFQERRSI